jgi:glycine oxidase
VYLAPKPDGTVFIGATRDEVGFDTSTTSEGITWLREAAAHLAPSVGDSAVKRAWAGLRPQTPDARPILGPVPGWENVMLACGHGGFGMLLSAITGQIMAEVITTDELPPLIQAFGLGRFVPQTHGSTVPVA